MFEEWDDKNSDTAGVGGCAGDGSWASGPPVMRHSDDGGSWEGGRGREEGMRTDLSMLMSLPDAAQYSVMMFVICLRGERRAVQWKVKWVGGSGERGERKSGLITMPISSAKARVMVPGTEIKRWTSESITMIKMSGERGQPCLMPLLTRISPRPKGGARTEMRSVKRLLTVRHTHSGRPMWARIRWMKEWETRSKAFLKSRRRR